MARKFSYKFENGFEVDHENMSAVELLNLENEHGKCTFNGWAEFMGVGKKSTLGVIGGTNSKGDAFKSGWHPGLGMHIGGPAHYSKVLKEKGMVEVGNEKRKDAAPQRKSYINEEIIGEAIQAGAEISGNEAEALIKGESLSSDA